MKAVALAGLVVGIAFIIGLAFGAILILALPAVRETFRRQLPGHGDGGEIPPGDNDDLGGDHPHWPGGTGYTDGHLG